MPAAAGAGGGSQTQPNTRSSVHHGCWQHFSLLANAGMARTKQVARKSIGGRQRAPPPSPPEPSDDSSGSGNSSEEEGPSGSSGAAAREVRFTDARPCVICGGPVLPGGEEQPQSSEPCFAWLHDATALYSNECSPDMKPWEVGGEGRGEGGFACNVLPGSRTDAGAGGS